jgi:hypothetical protein
LTKPKTKKNLIKSFNMSASMYENSSVVVQSKNIDKADFDLFLNSIFALRENDLNITELIKIYGVSRINVFSWLEPKRPDVDSLWRYAVMKFLLRYDEERQTALYKTLSDMQILKKSDANIDDKILSLILKVPIGNLERMRDNNSGWQKKFYNIVKRQHPKVLYYQFYYIRQFILKNTQYIPLGVGYGDIGIKG